MDDLNASNKLIILSAADCRLALNTVNSKGALKIVASQCHTEYVSTQMQS